MNFDDLKEYKDHAGVVAQSLALVGLAVVGCGFLSLTIYHASLGIPQIGFLRPKIFSTGLLLLALAAAGLWPAVYFATHKPRRADVTLKDKFISNLLTVEVFVVAIVVASCLYLRLLLDSPWPQMHWLLFAVLLPVMLSAVPALTWPLWACLLRFVLIVTSIVIGLVQLHDPVLTVLIWWLLGCGYSVYVGRQYLSGFDKFNYIFSLLIVIGIIGSFGRLIYPHITPTVCGGAPMPATITFADKTLVGNGQVKVWMIDETDAGFYFLQAKDAKKAVYVPRTGVSLIAYGE